MISIRNLRRIACENIINLFIKTISKLIALNWKVVNKQKDESSGINFISFLLKKKKSWLSTSLLVQKHGSFHEIVTLKMSECIRIDHELYVVIFIGSPVPLRNWFRYGCSCLLAIKLCLNNQSKNFSTIFKELS